MKDILQKAEQLGKAIEASDRFKAIDAARKAVGKDEALQADMKAFDELSRKVADLEKAVKPVEPEDKRRLRDLQTKVTANEKMQQLARVEADFAELMNRVNRAIQSQLISSTAKDE